MGLSAVLTYARVRDQTDEQMFDRAYRLRHNKGQVLMDKVCLTLFNAITVHCYTLNVNVHIFNRSCYHRLSVPTHIF